MRHVSALRLRVNLVGFVSKVRGSDVGLTDELLAGRVRHVVEGVEGVIVN